MILSELIRKGGLGRTMTATPATTATLVATQPATVASVATVAVAIQHEPTPELSSDEHLSIRAWFEHIGETDRTIIDELVDKCRDDITVRQYLLHRSEEIPEPENSLQLCTCGSCTYFKRIVHPHLGHCTQGQPENISGLWDDDERFCNHHFPFTAT